MIIPRAVSFITVLVGAYTMIVFNDFSNMMSFVFGGFRRLLDKMDGQELQRPRLCSCLPKTYWTKRRVVVTRALVRQGKLVYYIYVVLAAILLLNGNYEKRPLEVNRPLFWLSVIAGISRFAATISLVAFVRSVIKVLTGYSLGRKFVALQIINIFHLVTSIATTFLKSRNLPISSYGLVSADNRIDCECWHSESLCLSLWL
uniref:Ion_trans domain-containing protein n=1 Tax=Macrostomum lignano TaxID=282301 RepID=A0A1I8H0F3_9PLAT